MAVIQLQVLFPDHLFILQVPTRSPEGLVHLFVKVIFQVKDSEFRTQLELFAVKEPVTDSRTDRRPQFEVFEGILCEKERAGVIPLPGKSTV